MHYNDLQTIEQVNRMAMPEFRLRVLCLYDCWSLAQGFDPDNPPKGESAQQMQPTRKISRQEFARTYLMAMHKEEKSRREAQ